MRKAKVNDAEKVRGRGRCPKCACRRTALIDNDVSDFYASRLEVCANCRTVWEPMPAGGTHLDDDGTPFAFGKPCDNCAFRKGSPEREDPEAWKSLIKKLESWDGQFYCHKGVPIDPTSEDGFRYPKHRDGKQNIRKLRLCRGYLNAVVRRKLTERTL